MGSQGLDDRQHQPDHHPEGGTLGDLAVARPSGKPYTVSEYDLPAPSDYAAEMWPMLAAVASFQGWAGLYHYTFAHRPDDFTADRITGWISGWFGCTAQRVGARTWVV